MGLPELRLKPNLFDGSCRCKCKPKCENYIDIEYIGRYCENEATELAVKLINLAKGVNVSQDKYTQRGWTTRQEKVLTDWVTNKGINYGDYRIIGELINKSRGQVKNKVQHMRKEGKL